MATDFTSSPAVAGLARRPEGEEVQAPTYSAASQILELTAEQVAARDRKRSRRRRPRQAIELPAAFENFDDLPDAAYVNQRVVELVLDCSSSTIWRRVKSGDLPRPKKFGLKSTRWNVGELRRVLERD